MTECSRRDLELNTHFIPRCGDFVFHVFTSSRDILRGTMADNDRIIIQRTKPVLNREQKASFVLILGFGVLAFVFGGFYMWKHVKSPFDIVYAGPKFLTGDEKNQQEMDALKKADTDLDGLNDYEELYIYKTSPYLKDSDSDGTDDKTEITQGGDPNCAPNQPCAAKALEAVNPETLKEGFAADTAASAAAEAATMGATVQAPPSVGEVGAAFMTMTPDQIRTLLMQQGIYSATLSTLTDEDLKTLLAQAMSQVDSSSSSSSSSSSDVTTSPSSPTPASTQPSQP